MSSPHFNLEQYRVEECTESNVYYIPNFISEDEEEYLTRQINDAPKPKWKVLANRRLQVWGGELTNKALVSQPLPSFLNKYPDIISRLRETGAFSSSKHGAPNHVIVNEYLPGQGIMPHEDGPSYHPVVATISMGSHTVFNYYRYKDDASTPEDFKQLVEHADEGMPRSTAANTDPAQGGRAIDPKPVLSMLLEPRSLVITTSSLYTKHLHGIEPLTIDHLAKHGISKEGEGEETSEGVVDESLHEEPPDQAGGRTISNWKQVKSQDIRSVLSEGGSLARGVRLSLTCRDVERVVHYGRNAHLGRLH